MRAHHDTEAKSRHPDAQPTARRRAGLLALPAVIAFLLLAVTATPADADVRFYFGGVIGLPFYVPPPVVYAYPAYPAYPPPPAYVPGYVVAPPWPWPPGHWKAYRGYRGPRAWGHPHRH